MNSSEAYIWAVILIGTLIAVLYFLLAEGGSEDR